MRRLRACLVEEGVQGVAHVFCQSTVGPRRQEGLRFIDKDQDAPRGRPRPAKQRVQRRDALGPERPDVAAGHQRVLQTRRLGQAFGAQRLARARRAVQQHVAEGAAVLLGVPRGRGEAHESLSQTGRQHDAVQEVRLAPYQRVFDGFDARVARVPDAFPRARSRGRGLGRAAVPRRVPRPLPLFALLRRGVARRVRLLAPLQAQLRGVLALEGRYAGELRF